MAMPPDPRPWGEYVDVKRNLPLILAQEVRRRPRGVVGLGTITDPYQPLEGKFQLSRRCLEVLLRYDWPVVVQTRCPLVTRDVDLLTRFRDSEVGFSFSSASDGMRRVFELRAPPVRQRIAALGSLHSAGIGTFAFIGPILPGVTEYEAAELVPQLVGIVDYVMVDRLRLKPGVWQSMVKGMADNPVLVERFRRALWEEKDYFEGAEERIASLCRQHGLRVEEAFPKREAQRPSGSRSASRSPSSEVRTLDLLQI
jgi:DNA repair photolyase